MTRNEENELEEQISLEDACGEKRRPVRAVHGFEMYARVLEELINHIPVIAFVREAKEGGIVEFISDNISDLGYSAKDFRSGKLAYEDIIDPEDAPGALLELRENAREGAYEFSQTFKIRTKKGLIRWFREDTFISRNDEGRPVYYIGTLKEIAEQ
ncbi:PAS domain-containing protein [Methanolobus sp. ZRKC2]|uniref:PAS domain-containing protein n=1 Tax=Methanolobus sp. ZRKC2 TaxID=3125783 RepID=UPI003252D4E0